MEIGITSSELTDNSKQLGKVHIPFLPPEEINRYKNIHLAQVLIPKVLRFVLKLGCPRKTGNETYFVYIKRVKGDDCVSASLLKRKYHLAADMVSKLSMETDSTSFDVTLLVPLIQIACEKLADTENPVWFSNADDKVESLIMKVKRHRNIVMHGVVTEAISSEIFEEGVKILRKLLSVAGSFYNVAEKTLETQFSEFTKEVESLALTVEERKLVELQYIFHTEGLEESKAYWKEYCTTDAVPFTDDIVHREKVFHPMEVYIRTKTVSSNAKKSKISYTQLLRQSHYNGARVSIISGDAGSGKTTVMKSMALQFLRIIPSKVEFLDQIHLLIFLECRDRQARSLKELIFNNFPKTCRKISLEDAVSCFSLIGTLVFVDAFDELNDYSSQVVKELIKSVKTLFPFCHLVFTTRPHAVLDLEGILKREGIAYLSYEVVEITNEDDQIEFLRRYEMSLSNEKAKGLYESFRKIKGEAKLFFVYPINLVLFYYIYLHTPEVIEQWKHAGNVVGHIFMLYEMFMELKLKDFNIPNVNTLVKQLLSEINGFALDSLLADRILLSEEEFNLIKERCASKLSEWKLYQVDAYTILSVIFLIKYSPMCDTKRTYSFFHKSVQELMAGKAITKLFLERSHETVRKIVLEKLKEVNSTIAPISRELKFAKFLNVLRFVAIAIVDEKERYPILQERLQQLLAILYARNVDATYWGELALSCPTSDEIGRRAAAKTHKGDTWTVRTPREVMIASRLIKFVKLEQFKVFLSDEEMTDSLGYALDTLLQMINEYHTGIIELYLSCTYTSDCITEKALANLNSTSSRLEQFQGCLGNNEEAAKSLSSAVASAKNVSLLIFLAKPLEHHLIYLSNVPHRLDIRSRVISGHSATEGEYMSGFRLEENEKDASSMKNISRNVDESEIHKDYKSIQESEQVSGIPFANLALDSRSGQCEIESKNGKTTDISSENASVSPDKANDSPLDGISHEARVIDLETKGTSDVNSLTSGQINGKSKELKNSKKSHGLKLTSQVPETKRTSTKTRAVDKNINRGSFNNVIHEMNDAKASSSQTPTGDTKEVFRKEEMEANFTKEPVIEKDIKNGQFDFHDLISRRPLPIGTTRPVNISLDCTKETSLHPQWVTGTLLILAPTDKTYWRMYLRHWQGSEEDLDIIFSNLRSAQVKTIGVTGEARWEYVRWSGGRCSVCLQKQHKEGVRCVIVKLTDT